MADKILATHYNNGEKIVLVEGDTDYILGGYPHYIVEIYYEGEIEHAYIFHESQDGGDWKDIAWRNYVRLCGGFENDESA